LFVPLQKSLFEGLEEPDPTLLDAFQPRSSTKRLMLKPKVTNLVNGQPAVQSPGAISAQADLLEADKENKEIHQSSVILPEQCEDSWYVFGIFQSKGFFLGGEDLYGSGMIQHIVNGLAVFNNLLY
jgi:hypothetical protein